MFNLGVTLAGLVACAGAHSAPASSEAIPLATPAGVTIQQLAAEKSMRRAEAVHVYADANGMTLYTSSADKKGKSKCEAECAKVWIPAKAATEPPSSDWSVIRRRDGTKQWALFGQPLYTYAKESEIGKATGKSAENAGWEPAVYQTAKLVLPPDINVREVPDLFGQTFVNFEGRTLYFFKGPDPQEDYGVCKAAQHDCVGQWTPLAAPAFADRVGDFSVLRRRDGTPQWTYKGRGLYTFSRDVVPDIAQGKDVDPLFEPAMVRRTFVPKEVQLRDFRGITPVLTTAQGMTLYRRLPGTLSSGTYFLRGGRPYAPSYGYAVGLKGCEGACEKDWTPLTASSDAQSTGYWYVIARPDGTKVWAYKGFVLYTYAQDKAPGDYTGDAQWELVVSENPNVEAKLVADSDLNGDAKASGVMSWMRAHTF